MLKSEKSTTSIVGDFYKALLIVGPDSTQKVLKGVTKDISLFNDHIADYILRKVSRAFRIKVQKMKSGTSKGTRVDALMVAYMLMKNCIGYKPNDIKEKLYKDPDGIRKTLAQYSKLSEKVPHQKATIEKYNAIESDVINYIRLEQERRKLCLAD